jgi:hypothetical protein
MVELTTWISFVGTVGYLIPDSSPLEAKFELLKPLRPLTTYSRVFIFARTELV